MTETLNGTCAVCKVVSSEGRTYRIYFGNTGETSSSRSDATHMVTTRRYKIADSEEVFVCYQCLLTPGIKLAKFGLILFIAFGVITACTILGGILGAAGAVYFYKYGEERKKALSGVDKEMQNKYIEREKEALDVLGFRLAKKALISDMKSRGQKYNVFFTPAEYGALKPDLYS